MLMALFLTMSVGTRAWASSPASAPRATSRPDPTPPRDGMFVGPKSLSYQQLTPAAKGLYGDAGGLRDPVTWRLATIRVGRAARLTPMGAQSTRWSTTRTQRGGPSAGGSRRGGRPRRHLRRQVCDLQRPHLDQVPRLARVPAPIEPCNWTRPAPRRPRPHLGASLKARHPPLLPLARNRRHRRPAQRATPRSSNTRSAAREG